MSGASDARGEERGHELDHAYRTTTYRVLLTDAEPIDFRIGERSHAIDSLLARNGSDRWAFITAWNPRSRLHVAEENAARQAALVRVIREQGWLSFEGMGMPADSHWQPEASVLVLGISRDEAVAIAKRFEQNAIVLGERGGAAELVYCV